MLKLRMSATDQSLLAYDAISKVVLTYYQHRTGAAGTAHGSCQEHPLPC